MLIVTQEGLDEFNREHESFSFKFNSWAFLSLLHNKNSNESETGRTLRNDIQHDFPASLLYSGHDLLKLSVLNPCS